MVKTAAIGIRVNEELKAAIEAAAHDEERSVASFMERVVSAWLRDNGYLEKLRSKARKK